MQLLESLLFSCSFWDLRSTLGCGAEGLWGGNKCQRTPIGSGALSSLQPKVFCKNAQAHCLCHLLELGSYCKQAASSAVSLNSLELGITAPRSPKHLPLTRSYQALQVQDVRVSAPGPISTPAVDLHPPTEEEKLHRTVPRYADAHAHVG